MTCYSAHCKRMLRQWKHKVARQYVDKLSHEILKRPPDHCMRQSMHWYKPMKNIQEIWVMDEYIRHSYPKPHHDFVYSCARIKVTPRQAALLAQVSGSILVDQLKREVTARCGGLAKNQVTLGFVDDLAKGRIRGSWQTLRKEYARRINGDIATKRFPLVYS